MKVYLPTGRRNHLMFITPGLEDDSPAFKDENGHAQTFTIRFVDGVADVPWGVGQYLLSKEVAQKTPIIMPEVAAALAVQDKRVRNIRVLAGI